MYLPNEILNKIFSYMPHSPTSKLIKNKSLKWNIFLINERRKR